MQYYDNISDGKKIWKGFKQIIHFKPTTSLSLIKTVDNNKEFSDPKHISDAFNNYFANVGNKLKNEIPIVNKRPQEYLRLPQSNSFFISPTTTTEIENIITSLKSGKAVGPFSIPIDILKPLKSVISKPLEILFNTSFSTGTVPTDFKLANIIPVYKEGSRTCLSNYRPISLLSVFNKLLERLMYNRLIKYLVHSNIFYNKQFGFRTRHSTDHAILCIIDKMQRAIENRNISCGIFLDFSKAFDTVNHNILIKKLEHYGIRGIAKE